MEDRARLEKLLGMLGSTFDGERANAARMIATMAERRGVTIPELVFGPEIVEHVVRRPRAERSAQGKPTIILDALRGIVAAEADLEFVITAWELQFAVDVSEKHEADYELSEKQCACAQRIIDKVEKARARGAEA